MTPQERDQFLADLVSSSRARQGLPATVKDPRALAVVAAVLAGAARTKAQGRRQQSKRAGGEGPPS